jgi:hypothetical protein
MRSNLHHLGASAPKETQRGWRMAGYAARAKTPNPYPAGTLAHEEWQHGQNIARGLEKPANEALARQISARTREAAKAAENL